MLKLDLTRLQANLKAASDTFDFKKATLLLVGTLLLGTLVQGTPLKYSGNDASIRSLLEHPDVAVKLGISCKVISETNGLLHEFDTLGDIEVSSVGAFSPRSSDETLKAGGRALLSVAESNSFSFGSEYQIELHSKGQPADWRAHVEGRLRVDANGEGAAILNLSPNVFLKCVAFKKAPRPVINDPQMGSEKGET